MLLFFKFSKSTRHYIQYCNVCSSVLYSFVIRKSYILYCTVHSRNHVVMFTCFSKVLQKKIYIITLIKLFIILVILLLFVNFYNAISKEELLPLSYLDADLCCRLWRYPLHIMLYLYVMWGVIIFLLLKII